MGKIKDMSLPLVTFKKSWTVAKTRKQKTILKSSNIQHLLHGHVNIKDPRHDDPRTDLCLFCNSRSIDTKIVHGTSFHEVIFFKSKTFRWKFSSSLGLLLLLCKK